MNSYEIFLSPDEKRTILQKHFHPLRNLSRKIRCMQCGLIFAMFNFKVTLEGNGNKTLRCAIWPDCCGTADDWIDAETSVPSND